MLSFKPEPKPLSQPHPYNILCRRFVLPVVFSVLFLSNLYIFFSNQLPAPSSHNSSSFNRPALPPSLPSPAPCVVENAPQRTTRADARYILEHNVHRLVYVHEANMLVMTMGKAGSRTFWNMVFRGLTGRDWSYRECDMVHHDDNSCWEGRLTSFEKLPFEERIRVLSSPKTLRVAVQREPFSRLVSAFRSKFACDSYTIAVKKFTWHTHALRRHANWTDDGSDCMDISEFAWALDEVRRNAGKDGYPKTVYKIDNHLCPQLFHFDRIPYQLVLDVKDLSNATALEPISKRLKHPLHIIYDTEKRGVSSKNEIAMSNKAASMLHSFAALSQPAPVKHMT